MTFHDLYIFVTNTSFYIWISSGLVMVLSVIAMDWGDTRKNQKKPKKVMYEFVVWPSHNFMTCSWPLQFSSQTLAFVLVCLIWAIGSTQTEAQHWIVFECETRNFALEMITFLDLYILVINTSLNISCVCDGLLVSAIEAHSLRLEYCIVFGVLEKRDVCPSLTSPVPKTTNWVLFHWITREFRMASIRSVSKRRKKGHIIFEPYLGTFMPLIVSDHCITFKLWKLILLKRKQIENRRKGAHFDESGEFICGHNKPKS